MVERVEVIGTYKPYASTGGGDELRVFGRNFGPRGDAQPTLRYGAERWPRSTWLRAAGCEVRAHGEISCRSAPGTGTSLRVQLGGIGERGCSILTCRVSAVAYGAGVEISYVPPRVYEVVAANQHDGSTRGGGSVTITGIHFGEVGSVPRVEYAVPTSKLPTTWEGATILVAEGCAVTRRSEEIECELAEGGGAQLQASGDELALDRVLACCHSVEGTTTASSSRTPSIPNRRRYAVACERQRPAVATDVLDVGRVRLARGEERVRGAALCDVRLPTGVHRRPAANVGDDIVRAALYRERCSSGRSAHAGRL